MIFFSLCLSSCSAQPFFDEYFLGIAGLSDNEKILESVNLFDKPLDSSNTFIKRAAADALAGLYAAGVEIPSQTERRFRRELQGVWAEVFNAVEKPDKRKALNFLLNANQNTQTEACNYLIGEYEKKGIFNEFEIAAVEGHFFVLNSRYNEALLSFRIFMEDGSWRQNIPALFIEYPQLIADIGRAFQYTSYGAEGLSVFLQWENNLTDESAAVYRLSFYAARIARRIGQNSLAIQLFEKALILAPDTEQLQACIWYIMDLSLSNAAFFMQKLEEYISLWDEGNYYNDVLEIFLQRLVSGRDWANLIKVFSIIRESGTSSAAAYAWVIARTIEENFLSNEEKALAAEAINMAAAFPPFFKEAAYEAAENDVSSFLYYRSLASDLFARPLFEIETHDDPENEFSSAGEFLLGFFNFNVPEYALQYITQLEEDLSIDELRAVAKALEDEGMYLQSIQLVLRYIDRAGHIIGRTDLELLFPRPFLELVEIYAGESGIAPQILFALIRTESAFQSSVVSTAGAVGLTQLMPATALDMAGRIRRAGGPDYIDENNRIDLTDPQTNIHIGSYYLGYLTERFDNILLTLLAYNGGMNRIRTLRAASSLPDDLFLETISIGETRDYGRKVLAAAAVYEWLYYTVDE